MLSRVYAESCLAARSHLGGGFFDGLFRYAMGDEPLAKLLDGAFFCPLGFPLGKVPAKTVRDVGTNESLIASETERRSLPGQFTYFRCR
jgi:hypothetical protein